MKINFSIFYVFVSISALADFQIGSMQLTFDSSKTFQLNNSIDCKLFYTSKEVGNFIENLKNISKTSNTV